MSAGARGELASAMKTTARAVAPKAVALPAEIRLEYRRAKTRKAVRQARKTSDSNMPVRAMNLMMTLRLIISASKSRPAPSESQGDAGVFGAVFPEKIDGLDGEAREQQGE